jgi:hypothetical protein
MSSGMKLEVDSREIAKVMRVLRTLDKDLVADLRPNLRNAVTPYAKATASRINSQRAPMSGMLKYSSKMWGSVKSKVSISTAGSTRKNPNLVEISMIPAAGMPGVVIADMAGRVTKGKSLRGQLFIQQLNRVIPGWSRGGRIIYKAFMPYKPHVNSSAERIINAWTEDVSRKLDAL